MALFKRNDTDEVNEEIIPPIPQEKISEKEAPKKISRKEAKQLEKEKKQAEKELKILEEYGMQHIKDPQDMASIKRIVAANAGSSLFEFAEAFGGPNEKELLGRIYRQNKVLMEQNFIMIRQLDKIASILENKN